MQIFVPITFTRIQLLSFYIFYSNKPHKKPLSLPFDKMNSWVYLIIVDHIIPITKAPRLRECITRYGSNQNSLLSRKVIRLILRFVNIL